MKKLITSLLLVVLASSANATVIYSGNFSGSNTTSSSAVQSLSGSWSFEFDENLVMPSASFQILYGAMTSLSLTPDPLGATSFNTSNTSALLLFVSGVLNNINIYGQVGGNSLELTADDFYVDYNVNTGNTNQVRWSLASEPNDSVLASRDTLAGSFSISSASVPSPSTMWLFAVGYVAASFKRRKHRNDGIRE